MSEEKPLSDPYTGTSSTPPPAGKLEPPALGGFSFGLPSVPQVEDQYESPPDFLFPENFDTGFRRSWGERLTFHIGAAYLVRDERLENLLWQEADLDKAALEALTTSNLDGDELLRFAAHLSSRGLSVAYLFVGFDRDGSGTLDAIEFESALRQAGIDDLPFRDVDALMRTLDINGTGQIDLPELHNLLLQHEAAFDGGEEE